MWIDNPPAGDYLPPEQPAILSQKNCRYEQPVLGFMAGQPLKMHNNDDTTHNVRGFPKNNKLFNFGQPPGLPPRHRTFENPEKPLKIKCDVHRWMLSYAFVMDHPFFAVTDEEGHFQIDGLPAGTYTVKTWHEKLGELSHEINVAADPVSGVAFTYKRPVKK
ncbi:MAG: carboxypeptidase regulatory-like domain-containing protein [Candidatus Hydrogenedentota bacterium]